MNLPDPIPDLIDTKPTVAVLILAAGRSQRFGADTKQLAMLHGVPLVGHAVRTAQGLQPDRIAIVVGHDHEQVAAAARAAAERDPATGRAHPEPGARPALQPDFEVVVNKAYATGQASSLKAGVGSLADADIIVVLLADQPGIDPAVATGVIDKVRAGAPVARARYYDGPGHPVAFARQTFPALTQVSGDEGARQLMRNLDVVFVEVDTNAPADVDEPADLDRLHRLGS